MQIQCTCVVLSAVNFINVILVIFRTKFWRQKVSKPKQSFVIFGAKILYKKGVCNRLMKLTTGVNFINVKGAFFVRISFSSYILALNKLSYKKCAPLTLMKLTPGLFKYWNRTSKVFLLPKVNLACKAIFVRDFEFFGYQSMFNISTQNRFETNLNVLLSFYKKRLDLIKFYIRKTKQQITSPVDDPINLLLLFAVKLGHFTNNFFLYVTNK